MNTHSSDIVAGLLIPVGYIGMGVMLFSPPNPWILGACGAAALALMILGIREIATASRA